MSVPLCFPIAVDAGGRLFGVCMRVLLWVFCLAMGCRVCARIGAVDFVNVGVVVVVVVAGTMRYAVSWFVCLCSLVSYVVTI